MLLKMILQINRELEDLKEKVYTLMHGTGAKTDSNLPVLINRHTPIANDDTKLPTLLPHGYTGMQRAERNKPLIRSLQKAAAK